MHFTICVVLVTGLKHEPLYLENLPSAESYERSYMHRDVITHIVVTKYVKNYFKVLTKFRIPTCNYCPNPEVIVQFFRMVRHPRCVCINYNWINQLSNTTVWWLDICCLLHRYQLHVSALGHLQVDRLTTNL